ncbi:NAD-dependent DNA ligase LigA [Mycoplasma sp. SG1]|uniref:NAD-dependent DNA ligase LigA n=1 Tax=Mycoplasma sp. SG1 TaxID=2810348 RepID=UPI00202574B8|nr:NAD-dependent DNA ligase LigA [Mycoplasma sp. SG1]URM53017.1 NAD-dependent DNA ligase LigA [Mycoplasma sp. SG1]
MEKDNNKINLEIENLIKEINQAREDYWVKSKPKITDQEYDILFDRLKLLEQKYPQFKSPNSPTIKVGYEPTASNLIKAKHLTQMLSLSNAYNRDDILNFKKSILKKISSDSSCHFFLELKLDGLSIDLIYEDYQLQKAITRGDGLIGEDVTDRILTIENLPKKIKYKSLNVTGEVILSNSTFKEINKEIEIKNEALIKDNKKPLSLFLSPRNLTSGTVKHKSLELVKARKLNIFLYNVVNWKDFNLKTQQETLHFLKRNHFPVFEGGQLIETDQDMFDYFDKWEKEAKDLDFNVDGVVIKLNNLLDRGELGATINWPRWAIAYKFKAESIISELLDVEYGIGRSGKITFVAKIKPTYLDNSLISRVHLYNYKFIKDNQIKIHDNLEVIKSASVIPKIIKVHHIDKDTKEIEEPKICPFCSSQLVKYQDLVDIYCLNINCPGIVIHSLIHFCSQEGMNITGLGTKTIVKLYKLGIIKSIIDIYKLETIDKEIFFNDKDLNFKLKRYNNLIIEIRHSQKRPFQNLLFSLGIRFLGKGSIKLLIDHFSNIDNLINAEIEDFLKIKGIGKTTAFSVVQFFKNESNLNLIQFFKDNNFNLSDNLNQKKEVSIFTNKSVLLTGKFPHGKKAIYQYLQSCNANIVYNINNKLDYLIVGESPGKKLEIAKTLPNVNILTFSQYLELINNAT